MAAFFICNKEESMSLGEKIQTLRKQRNISQEQLAEQMNVTRQAVSKWELGESVPDVENIVRLSGILDVSTDYLLKDPTPTWPDAHDGMHSSDQGPRQFSDMELMAYDDYESDGDFNVRGSFRIEIGNAVYPIAVLAYLFIGFRFNLWHPGWLIFVAAWVIEEIIDFLKTGKLHISIYGVAGVAFLVLGFVFRLWHYAWMVFVLAWVIDTMVVRDKPKKKKKKQDRQYWE